MNFLRTFKYQISWKPVQCKSSCSTRADEQALMWKLIAALRNFSDGPKFLQYVDVWTFLPHLSNTFWVNSYRRGSNAFWSAWRQSGSETIASNVGLTDNDEWRGFGRKLCCLASLRFMAAQMLASSDWWAILLERSDKEFACYSAWNKNAFARMHSH